MKELREKMQLAKKYNTTETELINGEVKIYRKTSCKIEVNIPRGEQLCQILT